MASSPAGSAGGPKNRRTSSRRPLFLPPSRLPLLLRANVRYPCGDAAPCPPPRPSPGPPRPPLRGRGGERLGGQRPLAGAPPQPVPGGAGRRLGGLAGPPLPPAAGMARLLEEQRRRWLSAHPLPLGG